MDPATSLMSMERAAASLDAQVRDVLGPLHFSDSPQMWSAQLEGFSSEIYRSMVGRTKETIRAVAQEFRGMGRTRCLLDGVQDTVGRIDMLRTMLEAVEILALPRVGVTGIEPRQLNRLQDHVPALRDVMSSTIGQISRWQDEFGDCLDVFSILELPVETLESLLALLPTSVPDTHIARGRNVIQQLVGVWSETSYRPRSIMRSFTALIDQLDDSPTTPIHFLGREFAVRQFLDASQAFSRLRSQQISIGQHISRLERILDRFMDVVEPIVRV
ncbi:hypothetical protein LXA43DRAFT_1158169 [Ganoderma leucocontextum]|nr:hypothetical protein LXA43DRAFT_1158169 [Ganoderma leucocontextum]